MKSNVFSLKNVLQYDLFCCLPGWAGRPACTKPCTSAVSVDGRPCDRLVVSKLVSVCLGRPPGRPAAVNGYFLTVGRSTGRVILAKSAANGYFPDLPINTRFERGFQ